MLSYSHRFGVFVWAGEKDSNTLRVNAYFLQAEKKNTLRFQAKISWARVRLMNWECDERDV